MIVPAEVLTRDTIEEQFQEHEMIKLDKQQVKKYDSKIDKSELSKVIGRKIKKEEITDFYKYHEVDQNEVGMVSDLANL